MGELQQPRNKNGPLFRWTMINSYNSKSFVNGSKLIIRNNLVLCKHSEIYLIWNFQKQFFGPNGMKI